MAENYYLNHTATQIDAILNKVDGMEAGANVNVQVDWNQTTTTADDYIKNKPTIPDAQIQSDWNQTDTDSKDFIKNKPTIPAAQVNSDWNAVSGIAEILNKPTLGTASALNVPASGDAATTEVVKGDDSRLTDARHADDVYSWAKDANKPVYSSSEVSDLSNLTTTDKTSLVGAVNELNAILGDVNTVLEEVL